MPNVRKTPQPMLMVREMKAFLEALHRALASLHR
jgi:hypothetical protein